MPVRSTPAASALAIAFVSSALVSPGDPSANAYTPTTSYRHAMNEDGTSGGDIRRRTRQALANLQRVLDDHGLTLVDVAKTTV
jgi:enamine deaminase RidA (YjgF/YER057c/UK114 family)